MSVKLIDIGDFFRRLQVEQSGSTHFTWLIGAGLSVSAGIPLAKSVSSRIMLFEYYIESGEDCPWWSENDTRRNSKKNSTQWSRIEYNNVELEHFFEWIEEMEKNEDELRRHLEIVILHFQKKPEFKGVSIDQPECYQICFKHFFQDPKIGVTFLNHLIRRAKGINLAHLALAGILRDHPEWGNTVFTTNFDDLLLKALLHLNHNARVFGEFENKTVPGDKSNYPQIVYLHGKHTGYNLLNTDDQIKLVNPTLQEAFRSHIRNTNLIVIGYSGWDDLVINTLKEWKTNIDLIHGNLYWIPYLSEERILPQVWEFLNELPQNRVKIIVNRKNPLNADNFMLEICNFLNYKKGGFTPYRREIIKNAENLHAFVINQLGQYPDYHPKKALEVLKKIREEIKLSNPTESIFEMIEEVITISNHDDIPKFLLADIKKGVGESYVLLRKYKESISFLEDAVDLFLIETKDNELAKERRMDTHLLLAEVKFECQILLDVEKHCRIYLAESERNNIKKPEGLCKIHLILSHLTLSRSFEKPLLHINSGRDSAELLDNSDLWLAEFDLLEGAFEIIDKNYHGALKKLNKALKVFDRYSMHEKSFMTKMHLSNMHLNNFEFFESKKLLSEVLVSFEKRHDYLGIGIANANFGEVLFREGSFKESIEYHKKAIDIFKLIDHKYNYINGLTDIALIYKRLDDHVNLKIVSMELKELKKETQNPYYDYSQRSGSINYLNQIEINEELDE